MIIKMKKLSDEEVGVYSALIRKRLKINKGEPEICFVDSRGGELLFNHLGLGLIVLDNKGIRIMNTGERFSGMGALRKDEYWAFKEGYEGRLSWFEVKVPSLRAYWAAGNDVRNGEMR